MWRYFLAFPVIFFLFEKFDAGTLSFTPLSRETTLAGRFEECGVRETMWLAAARSGKWRAKHQLLDQQARTFFSQKNNADKSMPPPYIIPVVVHIIHQNGAENITDAQVLQGIQYLNDGFANANFYDAGNGVDTKIQFCLAKRDPNGNATTGVNRIASPLTDVSIATNDLQMKDLSRWNPFEYVNIWLVRSINAGNIAGYAYLPASHGGPEDGVVMLGNLFDQLGEGNTTLIHEFGHYFGLYHTFEGGCFNDDCLADGDQVCDTPPDGTTAPPGDCSAIINSCTTDIPDENDINWNYVDYGNQPCRSGYTQGQTDRMHFFIENARQSLLNSPACQDPCLSPIAASFNASAVTVNIGGTVNFTNTTTGGTGYTWQVNGVTFASTTNASYPFNTLGTYEITLLVNNGDPNCSGSFSQTIEVVCPVNAAFLTSNLYPSPSSAVNFTNTSSGGNGNSWTLNGMVVSSSSDFSYIFPSLGQYTVCLETSNGLCTDEFCQLVFVIESDSGDCNGTYLRGLGSQSVFESANVILPTPDGNFLIGGRSNSASLLMLAKPSGETIWSRTFDMTSGNDFIWRMFFDSDGMLVVAGRDQLNSFTTNYVFRYDYLNNTTLWARQFINPSWARFEGMVEKQPGGNYFVFGNTVEGAENNLFMEVNRNNGNIIWVKGFDYGNTDNFLAGVVHQGAIYLAGQQRSGGLDQIRATFSKMDFSGNLEWTRFYYNDLNASARTYFYDNHTQNDTLIGFGRGDLNGSSFTDVTLQLLKTNLNGIVYSAKSYDIVGSNTEFPQTLMPLPDGYILQGSHIQSNGQSGFYFIRVDNQGAVLWAKSVASIEGDWGVQATLYNGNIYFAGRSTLNDPSSMDIIFGKMSLNGEISGDGCTLIADIQVVVDNIANPYEGLHTLNEIPAPFVLSPFASTPGNVNVPSMEIPGCECNEFFGDTCATGLPLHTVSDAFVHSISGQCNGDSMLVTLQICNADSVTLPALTPISFYQNNPSTTAATLLATVLLPVLIAPGSCEPINLEVPLPANQLIYIVVNDDGTTATPFDLASDFPNTSIEECDFKNNIGSFVVNYTPPLLDLGPDQSTCHFDVTELDAGSGFASYQWSEGGMEQTFTAGQPGTYSVTVTDACGGTQTDDILLSVDPGTVVEIGFDFVQICSGDSFVFAVNGFQSYQWFPADLVDCPTCPSVTVSPNADTCFIVVATDNDGCFSADTVCVMIVTDTVTTYQSLLICEGDTTDFFGTTLSQPGIYISIDTTGNCVEVTNLTLGFFPKTAIEFATDFACPFLFDGEITATPNGGTPPYSYAWETGTSTTNLLSDLDVGTYSVTVTDANGCAVVDSVEVGASIRPEVSSEVQDASCFGVNDGVLTIIADDPSLQFSFKGSPFSSQTVYDSIWPGGDQFFVVDTFGCEWVNFFLVDAPDKIVLQLPNSIEAPLCDSVQIEASSDTSPLTWSWSPSENLSCSDCPNPITSPFITTTYYLTVTDTSGCTGSDSVNVVVDFDGKAYIPNAFSPNDDGLNDFFYVLSRCVTEVRVFRVFDRWGEMVFEKSNTPPNDPMYGWNGKFKGKHMNSDVFVYHIIVVLADGSEQVYKGDVTLLR